MQDRENATWGALELAITNANREDLGHKLLSKCKLYKVWCMNLQMCIVNILVRMITFYCESRHTVMYHVTQ